MRVGFTGTQIGMSSNQKIELLRVLSQIGLENITEAHHGDCIGADAEFDKAARALSIPVHIHRPTSASKQAFCYQPGDRLYPPKPYLDRDRDIVDNSDVLIAAPRTDEEEVRSGTWYTVRYARKQGTPVIMLRR